MLVNFRLLNNGQVCCSAKRIFVHHLVYDQFKTELLKEIQKSKTTPKFENGILYGSDSIELNLKSQLHRWRDSESQTGNIVYGDLGNTITQHINVIEVKGMCVV